MIRLLVALGNPGLDYARTRHNIAWQMIEHFSFFAELLWADKFSGLHAATSFWGDKTHLLKPLTFMNRTGFSVTRFMNFYKIEIDHIVVIHDDLGLPFGSIGFKDGGGLAGHNGLRSVAGQLGSPNFKRLRLGISRPAHPDISGYVLENFSSDEGDQLDEYLDNCARLVESELDKDFESLCEKYRKVSMI